MAANPIVTLTTDYGTNDHLVGVLKGVILSILPNATLVDINHHVTPFDILDGALAIGSAYHYFPARTIHLHVSDAEMAKRKAAWKKPAPKYPRGYGALFSA